MGNIFGREEPPPPPPPRQPPQPTPTYNYYARPTYEYRPRPPRPVCIQYSRGNCPRGAACQYSHTGPVAPVPPRVQQPKRPCRYFAQGNCRRGAACTFLHDPISVMEAKAKEDPADHEAMDETWMRDLGDVWVQFGDGAAVTDISFPTDFSSVRINNLPGNSTLKSVSGLLSSVGITVSTNDIRLIKPPAKIINGTTVCIVKKKDPGFAQVACRKLRTVINPPNLDVASVPVTNTQATVFRQVDSNQVRCSWHKPTRTATLSFGSRPIATCVAGRFRSGQYKVNRTKVMASLPPVEVPCEGQPSSWKITLSGLVEAVREADVTGSIKIVAHKPYGIEIGELNYVADVEVDAIYIQSMLNSFGALERWVLSKGKGKRITAYATFIDESHAQAAVSALDGKPLPFCPTGKLFVQPLISVRFKVSTRVFEVVKTLINEEKANWERQHINYFAFPGRGFYRVLKLEGEDRKAVSKAKKCLEAIVGGNVVLWQGKKPWYDDLKIDRDTLKRLRRIETDLGVVITREVQASRFRVYGPKDQNERVAKALHRLIEDTRTNHTIHLDQEGELEWALGGGISVLTTELGHGKIAFDETSQRVIVRGSDQDLTAAKIIIARRQMEPLNLGRSQGTAMCPICFCEPEDPVSTSCGHTYCGPCFVNMCEAETQTTKDFSIRCVGSDGKCRAALPIAEVHSVLLAETFEGLLEASFASFVRCCPDQFRRCPTPDCTQIYRVTSNAVMAVPPIFTCSLCLVSICTACHAAHLGKTCAEHKSDASGGLAALVKIKEELGIHDCPKCTTSMERIDGCNHMTCKGCGSHICWKCLSIVDREEIYKHMTQLHGDIYN